ncbi:MAG TPA: LuxR C-terminal-related transcriptional regulator [Actinomycetota bacterium]
MTGVSSPTAGTRAVRASSRGWSASPFVSARPGTVPRERLFARIDASGADVIAVIAAPGYGKTTLLAEYARRDPRPVVWLSLDARDDDPAILLADLAVALDSVASLDPELLQRLTASGTRVPATRVRELTRCIDDFPESVVIVLDDLHLVKSLGALDIVSALLDHVPPGSAVAMASRTMPDLPLARLRAAGRLLELGDDDLAMDERETALLIEGVDPDLPGEAVALIGRRTEGWAVAVYLATLSVRDQDDPIAAASRVGGDDRAIGDYVREELLRGLPRRHLRFMTRTSILHELIPDLCDEVVGVTGSAKLLPELIRSNELVVPVVGRPGRYRYHQLFRDVLHEELRRSEPGLIPELHRRAAAWSETNGSPDDAIEYARTGGNVEDAARLVCSVLRRYIGGARLQTLERWLAWFDESDVLAYPPLALATGWYHAFVGDEDPVRWLRIAESTSFEGPMPDGSSSYGAAIAMLRAALCVDGPDRMAADVVLSADLGAPASDWRVFHHLVAGESALMAGDTERALASFRTADELASPGQAAGHAMALSESAAIAADSGRWDDARRYVDRARSVVASHAVGEILQQPLMWAVGALLHAREGEPDLALAALVEAQKLRATSSFAMPSFSIRGRLVMARAYLAVSDVEGARTVLAEAREFQRRRPNIGTLADALDETEERVRRIRGSGRSGPATMTTAELRVLALLPTHLSFRQIGERLFVSNNTVKSHAMSIYRKLGVSSRAEAVERAVALGLLDL